MSGSKRAGRIDLASLLAGIAGGALVALVLTFLFPGPGRAPQAGPMHEGFGMATPVSDLSALEAGIARLEQRLAGIESALRSREAPSERAPVASPEGEADPVPLSKTEELHEDLHQLELRLDLLTAAWKEHDKPTFELPTLEQVHAARRDVDWVWLGELAELYMKDEGAATEKARLMTFEQLLKRVGVPDAIANDNGMWMYFRPEHVEGKWRGVYFRFVGDSVSSVRTDK